MNTSLMFSSKTDMWSTPQPLFDRLNEIYGFTTDVCATEENAKVQHFFSPEQDGLKEVWSGVCWMNPPYGRTIGSWVQKAYGESSHCTVVALLPSRTDTRWFHDYIYKKDMVTIEFLRGRIKFGGHKNCAPFPSMLVVFKNRQDFT